MESFNQCAIQMLREFRNLLRHSPLAIASDRLLQLMALNMFAVDCTQLTGESLFFLSFYVFKRISVKMCNVESVECNKIKRQSFWKIVRKFESLSLCL